MIINYVSSVLIYMIVIYCMLVLFERHIRENGWVKEYTIPNNDVPNRFQILVVFSAIPVVRVLIIAIILMMALYKEDYITQKIEEWKNKD